MTTRERIEQDLTREQKARNASAVSTLRMLRAALKNADISARGGSAPGGEKMSTLDEAGVLAVIAREVKKLKDSLEAFKTGGRQDLAEGVSKEIVVLEAYLPQQLGDDELREIVRTKVAALGTPPGLKDMGKVVGLVMKDVQGKADGARVSAMVKESLSAAPT